VVAADLPDRNRIASARSICTASSGEIQRFRR